MAVKIKPNLAQYYFHEGTNFEAYKYLGAHRDKENKTYTFRTWAPGADEVFLAGDFNGWNQSCPMKRETKAGLWSVTVSDEFPEENFKYKYIIKRNGRAVYKSDPYGFYCEKAPDTASIFFESDFKWSDTAWMKYRKKNYKEPEYAVPINIYEVHAGSWKLKEDGGFLDYRQLAHELCDYVKSMGYTHVELMPIAEHPFDGSWGYQVCGYYAPTSRYGNPDDFRYFVDYMHKAGVGVILDWVPAHFPKDEHGLYEFDGGPLYEYQGNDRMESRGWGTRRFDVGRNEVQSFLFSNALYWLREFHIDGLRVDAVASMIYLDFDKQPGEWFPNPDGSNDCKEAVAFFKKLGNLVRDEFPDVLFVAEESTAWSNVTKPEESGGLGFNYKWNMGWMNDLLSYIELDPIFRKDHHEKVTFSLMYAYSENFILPISHDEVVHGKKSLLDKAPGDYWQKFAGTRAFLGYMITHPGKKLLFMGSEIGQFREWDYKGSIEWFLLDYEMHAKFKEYVKDLNFVYLENKPLWEIDYSWDGFRWIDADNRQWGLLSYVRYDSDGNVLVTVINFTPVGRDGYIFGVPEAGLYTELINSDDTRYGGTGKINPSALSADKAPCHNMDYSLKIDVGPYGAAIFKHCGKKVKNQSGAKQNKTDKSAKNKRQ